MNTAFWIARRFSFARKRFRIINVISAISLAGIIIGVSTLLVVMSVLNGFQKLAFDMFTTIEGHVQMVSRNGGTMHYNDALLKSIAALDGVASAEPFLEGAAIISGAKKSELIVIKGMSENAHIELMRNTGARRPYFSPEGVAAGELLSGRMQLTPFSEVRIFSPELIGVGLELLSEPYMLSALEIPRTTLYSTFSLQRIFDDRYVLASNEFVRRVLLTGKDRCTGIDIRGEKGVSASGLRQSLDTWLVSDGNREHAYMLRPLESKYHDIFAVMELEKWASFSILMLVVLVAALSLTGSLAMTAIDKQKELFYLRCLGLEKPQFIALFMIQGGITGIAGTAIGASIAWAICRLQELYGLVELPSKSAFIIEAYPVSMEAGDFLVVGITAIALTLLVSLYPAGKAASIAISHSLDTKTN